MPKAASPKTDDRVKGTKNIRNKFAPVPPQLLPTKILPLDLILGGGIPRGSFIEVASPSGVGKSTLCLHAGKNICAQGYRVDWWDYEHALTDSLKAGIGIDGFEAGGEFVHMDLTTYGDGEEVLDGTDKADLPDLIIIDSETSMMPDKMKGGSILDKDIGLKSRMCANFMLKYKGWCRRKNISIVYINQMRTKFMGNSTRDLKPIEDSAGGNAFKFYCDIRLRMRRTGDIIRQERTIEGEKKIIYGVDAAIWAIKNREVRSHIELSMPILFGKGVSNIQIMKKLLIGAGAVQSAGSYFKVDMGDLQQTVQGNVGLFGFIKDNMPKINKYIEDNDVLYLAKEL